MALRVVDLESLKTRLTLKQIEGFWSRVDTSGDCWVWTGIKIWGGYGRIKIAGENVLAHRLAYAMCSGFVGTATIDHLCRNRICVRPSHLEAVSFAENVRRGEGYAAINARRTHCTKGHPLSGPNLRIYKRKDGRSARICRKCQGWTCVELEIYPPESFFIKETERGV